MTPLVREAFQSSETFFHFIFQAALGEFEFFYNHKTQLKSFEDITVNAHKPYTYLINISLR